MKIINWIIFTDVIVQTTFKYEGTLENIPDIFLCSELTEEFKTFLQNNLEKYFPNHIVLIQKENIAHLLNKTTGDKYFVAFFNTPNIPNDNN